MLSMLSMSRNFELFNSTESLVKYDIYSYNGKLGFHFTQHELIRYNILFSVKTYDVNIKTIIKSCKYVNIYYLYAYECSSISDSVLRVTS